MYRSYLLLMAVGSMGIASHVMRAEHCSFQQPVRDTLPPVTLVCLQAKAGAARAGMLAKDSLFLTALKHTRDAFSTDPREYVVAFGRDISGKLLSAGLIQGTAVSGRVPGIAHAVADLHNHINNVPPDAGDFYGLTDLNKSNPGYDTRFVLTAGGTVYALLVTDPAAADLFNRLHPRQPPAFKGGPPGFPEKLVDEFRELKYQYGCTDEMAMAYLLVQYHAGVVLLKQVGPGDFKMLITQKATTGNAIVYSAVDCPW